MSEILPRKICLPCPVPAPRRSGRHGPCAPPAPPGRCGWPWWSRMDPQSLILLPVRGLAGRGDRAELDADLAADPLHPLPARHLLHDDFVAAHVAQAQRVHRQIADRKARHLRLGVGPPHGVGVHHRDPDLRRYQQRLQTVAPADLQGHHGAELAVEVLLHHGHCGGAVAWVVQAPWPTSGAPMLETTATRSSSVQVHRVHQREVVAVGVELAHVKVVEIGAAAAARAQDPGADGKRLDLLRGDEPHQNPVNSSSPMKRAMPRTSTSATPMAKADTAAAVGSKEYLR